MNTFHKRAARHMTRQHIQKHADRSWTYLNYEEFDKKFGLLSRRTYIQRKRGTLRKYMETYREDFLQETMEITRQSGNVNKIFWWKQGYITKADMTALTNFWFK